MAFGPARGAARFLYAMTSKAHHNEPLSDDRIADAHSALDRLWSIAVDFDPGPSS
jgi:hypothetical protein